MLTQGITKSFTILIQITGSIFNLRYFDLTQLFFFLAVHVVQKKISWANKDAVVVIADQQQKNHPSIPPAEKNNNTESEKKKRKSREEAKEDKSLSKRLKESGQNVSSDLKRNERQEREFQQLNEGIEKLNESARNHKNAPL